MGRGVLPAARFAGCTARQMQCGPRGAQDKQPLGMVAVQARRRAAASPQVPSAWQVRTPVQGVPTLLLPGQHAVLAMQPPLHTTWFAGHDTPARMVGNAHVNQTSCWETDSELPGLHHPTVKQWLALVLLATAMSCVLLKRASHHSLTAGVVLQADQASRACSAHLVVARAAFITSNALAAAKLLVGRAACVNGGNCMPGRQEELITAGLKQ